MSTPDLSQLQRQPAARRGRAADDATEDEIRQAVRILEGASGAGDDELKSVDGAWARFVQYLTQHARLRKQFPFKARSSSSAEAVKDALRLLRKQ